MTTYNMKTALRRALTTLVGSQPSAGGLPPSQTDDLETPEEGFAARLVQRLGLEPPVDVERIARTMATVETKRFPDDIDGLCLDLKVRGKRPKIWVSRNIHRVRRRFTLAHEIGHIIIPWHTGDIVDDLDAPDGPDRSRWRVIESEANRFASELLMPTAWVLQTMKRMPNPAALMHTIVEVADVSHPAALFKVRKLAPPGYIVAEVSDRVIVWSGSTPGTRMRPLQAGTQVDEVDDTLLYDPKKVFSSGSSYFWWKVRDSIAVASNPSEPWRDSLESILLSVPQEHRRITRSRVNAIVGVAIGRLPKGSDVTRLYQRGLAACQNRTDRDRWVELALRHPSFNDYLLARCYERAVAKDD